MSYNSDPIVVKFNSVEYSIRAAGLPLYFEGSKTCDISSLVLKSSVEAVETHTGRSTTFGISKIDGKCSGYIGSCNFRAQ